MTDPSDEPERTSNAGFMLAEDEQRPLDPTAADYSPQRYYVLRYTTMRSNDPSLLIMASLAEGPKHGYAITRDVHEIVGVKLGPGTLYGAIARLEERGLIEPLEADDRRRPYRLTGSGAAALREQLTAQERLASVGLRRLSAAETSA